ISHLESRGTTTSRDTSVATFVGSPAMNLLSGTIRDGRRVVSSRRLEIAMGKGLVLQAALRLRRGSPEGGPGDVAVVPGRALEGHVHGVENHGWSRSSLGGLTREEINESTRRSHQRLDRPSVRLGRPAVATRAPNATRANALGPGYRRQRAES